MAKHSDTQRIHIHTEAPAKPAWGQACNGCGVCCLVEPCPVGRWISGREHGACDALQWSAPQRRYLCGVVAAPQTLWPRLPRPLVGLVQRLARRWIAAAQGCDSTLEVQREDPPA